MSVLLNSEALCAKIYCDTGKYISVKDVIHTTGVLGSHQGLAGGIGGTPGGRPSVPTAMDCSDAIPRVRKGVKYSVI